MNITVILNGYNRGHLLQEQLKSVQKQTIPPEDIMMWYNKGSEPQVQVPEIKKAAYCTHNFSFFGRFAFALLAQTEYVAIFDDDTIPGNKWFENCLNCMKTHPGILGASGVIFQDLNNYLKSISFGTHTKNNNILQVDLVGHSWFIKKEWLKYMWMEEPYSYENGEDFHLSYSCQKYGNIKTYVPPHDPNNRETWGSLKPELGSDNKANYKKQDHYLIRTKCLQHYVNYGWCLLKEKDKHEITPWLWE